MIKKFIKYIHNALIWGYKGNSKSYIKHLRKNGVSIGENVTFYEPYTNYIDTQKGFLVEIGNNVEITRGCIILTHDYSWSVLKQLQGEIIGSRGKVKIGNNVFIGFNTIIMKGVTIGNNVIIGAGSIVTKNIEDNSVVCGNPARKICTVEEFYNKRKKKYLDEAVEMFNQYYEKYNKIPEKNIFDEFFWLFEERKEKQDTKEFEYKMKLTGNEKATIDRFTKSKPQFNGFEEFCQYCLKNELNEKENGNEK